MTDRRPILLAGLGLLGLTISGYLTAYQLGLVRSVWDPLFDGGSARVLTSPISRALPVPDASLGAVAYALDVILALAIALRLGPRWPLAAILATVSSLAALAAIGLAILQPVAVGTFCTLCLASASISVGLALGALAEARDQARTRRLEVNP